MYRTRTLVRSSPIADTWPGGSIFGLERWFRHNSGETNQVLYEHITAGRIGEDSNYSKLIAECMLRFSREPGSEGMTIGEEIFE